MLYAEDDYKLAFYKSGWNEDSKQLALEIKALINEKCLDAVGLREVFNLRKANQTLVPLDHILRELNANAPTHPVWGGLTDDHYIFVWNTSRLYLQSHEYVSCEIDTQFGCSMAQYFQFRKTEARNNRPLHVVHNHSLSSNRVPLTSLRRKEIFKKLWGHVMQNHNEKDPKPLAVFGGDFDCSKAMWHCCLEHAISCTHDNVYEMYGSVYMCYSPQRRDSFHNGDKALVFNPHSCWQEDSYLGKNCTREGCAVPFFDSDAYDVVLVPFRWTRLPSTGTLSAHASSSATRAAVLNGLLDQRSGEQPAERPAAVQAVSPVAAVATKQRQWWHQSEQWRQQGHQNVEKPPEEKQQQSKEDKEMPSGFSLCREQWVKESTQGRSGEDAEKQEKMDDTAYKATGETVQRDTKKEQWNQREEWNQRQWWQQGDQSEQWHQRVSPNEQQQWYQGEQWNRKQCSQKGEQSHEWHQSSPAVLPSAASMPAVAPKPASSAEPPAMKPHQMTIYQVIELERCLSDALRDGWPRWLSDGQGGDRPRKREYHFETHNVKEGARIDFWRGLPKHDRANAEWVEWLEKCPEHQKRATSWKNLSSCNSLGNFMEMTIGCAYAAATGCKHLPLDMQLLFNSDHHASAWSTLWYEFQKLGFGPEVGPSGSWTRYCDPVAERVWEMHTVTEYCRWAPVDSSTPAYFINEALVKEALSEMNGTEEENPWCCFTNKEEDLVTEHRGAVQASVLVLPSRKTPHYSSLLRKLTSDDAKQEWASVVMDGLEKSGKPKSSAEQSAEERADQIENLLTVTLNLRIQHLGRLWKKRDPRVWNASQKEFSGSDMDVVFTGTDIIEIRRAWKNDFPTWCNNPETQKMKPGHQQQRKLHRTFPTMMHQICGNKRMVDLFLRFPVYTTEEPAPLLQSFMAAQKEVEDKSKAADATNAKPSGAMRLSQEIYNLSKDMRRAEEVNAWISRGWTPHGCDARRCEAYKKGELQSKIQQLRAKQVPRSTGKSQAIADKMTYLLAAIEFERISRLQPAKIGSAGTSLTRILKHDVTTGYSY